MEQRNMNITLDIHVIILWIFSVNLYQGYGYIPVGAMVMVNQNYHRLSAEAFV